MSTISVTAERIFNVLILAGVVVQILFYLIGKDFFRDVVNQYRLRCLLLALGLMGTGFGLLSLEKQPIGVSGWLTVLSESLEGHGLTTRTMAACLVIGFGAVFVALWAFCVACLPRHPSSFSGSKAIQEAVNYYVRKLRGGLDYAHVGAQFVANSETALTPAHEIIAEATCDNALAEHLRLICITDRTGAEQVLAWRQVAERLLSRIDLSNQDTAEARQGTHCKRVYDLRFGGLMMAFARAPGHPHGSVYVFAAALDQQQMKNGSAERHFDLLVRALRECLGTSEW
jgi:hypothetical protein